MKKKNSTRLISTFVLGSVLFFTSCTKETLQNPTENKFGNGSVTQGQVSTVNSGTVTSNARTAIAIKPTIPSPDIGFQLIPTGLYSIHPAAYPNLAIGVQPGSTRDDFIRQINSTRNLSYQWWYVTNLGNGYYSIKSALSSKTLCVPNGSGPGVKIQQSLYQGTLNQQWRIGTSASTGISRIYNGQTLMAWDVPDASSAQGVLIQQFTPHNGSNQAWRFVRECGYDCLFSNTKL